MIEVHGITKTFRTKQGVVHALREVDLLVHPGELVALLGPSGSGKTTLLRCIAGLEKPDSGQIVLGEQTVFSDRSRLFTPPEYRQLGMVFQSYAIWPHMTVFDNVALPLTQRKRRIPKSEVRERVHEALHLVHLDELAERPAPLLSGGQQQRVALARALAGDPKALLMDEPLSNLDAFLREEVRSEIRELVKQVGVTVLYVTHDQVEAMAIGDRIAIMTDGVIRQIESPQVLYEQPANIAVAEFFGSINRLEGTVQAEGVVETEIGTLHTSINTFEHVGSQVVVGVRSEDIHIVTSPSGDVNEFEGEILSRAFLGYHSLYHLQTRDRNKRIVAKSVGTAWANGRVYFRIPREKIVVFPAAELSAPLDEP